MTLGDIDGFRSGHARWIEAATSIGSLRAIAAANIERARAITVEARLMQGQT